MIDGRKDESIIGFIHLCAFCLLILSGERAFGIALNKEYTHGKISTHIPPFSGSYNDLMIRTLGGNPDTDKIAGFIYIGQKTKQPNERKRPDLSKIIIRYGEEMGEGKLK